MLASSTGPVQSAPPVQTVPTLHPVPPVQPVLLYRPVHTVARFLAAFPIAFFISAFVTDIVYVNTTDMMWANFSSWLLAVGIPIGVLAVLAGIIGKLTHWRTRKRRGRGFWYVRLGCFLILALSVLNAFIHSRDAYTSVMPAGILLSGLVAILVVATCWLDARLTNRPVVAVRP